jgi:hypothetical protein
LHNPEAITEADIVKYVIKYSASGGIFSIQEDIKMGTGLGWNDQLTPYYYSFL